MLYVLGTKDLVDWMCAETVLSLSSHVCYSSFALVACEFIESDCQAIDPLMVCVSSGVQGGMGNL